jgi:hypothetical protein
MKIKQYKQKFIDELHEQLWRKEVNLAYDNSKIPDVKKLQDDKFAELDELKREFDAIDAFDNTKATRMKGKELNAKIQKAQEFIVSCDETISLIKETSRKDKEKIKNIKERVEFAKNFKYPTSDYANND